MKEIEGLKENTPNGRRKTHFQTSTATPSTESKCQLADILEPGARELMSGMQENFTGNKCDDDHENHHDYIMIRINHANRYM